jgi:predicted anti-sigma-YlaC factor YlaD
MTGSHQPPHVTEETLILLYYGEAEASAQAQRHLASCRECREQFERLRYLLALVDREEVPEPRPGFERDVWARLEPELQRGPSWWSRLVSTPAHWVYGGALAALVLAAFVAGRLSVGSSVGPAVSPETASLGERVLVVAVLDHLDQSQMVLVELLNADLAGPSPNIGAEQSRARNLVAASRLYRQTAVQAGDEGISDVLDELERVLLEIANAPQNSTKEDLEALRARIDAHGLLFRVRVVHSEMRERERQAAVSGSTS